jgi:hypothetical protein
MKTLIVYFFLLLLNIVTCKAQSDCVYDDKILTDDFLKNSELLYSYKWDDKEKEGVAILNSGNILNVKRWACNHIGTSANMMIIKESFDSSFWKKYIEELSMIVCDEPEIELIESIFPKYSYLEDIEENSCRKEIDLSNDVYPEFYLTIYEFEDFVVISTFFYKTP